MARVVEGPKIEHVAKPRDMDFALESLDAYDVVCPGSLPDGSGDMEKLSEFAKGAVRVVMAVMAAMPVRGCEIGVRGGHGI